MKCNYGRLKPDLYRVKAQGYDWVQIGELLVPTAFGEIWDE